MEIEIDRFSNPKITKKEEMVLNQIVDLLLKGKKIRNIASCMIPKLSYILNVRLQDAINRGFNQTVLHLQRHIEHLNQISEYRILLQQEQNEHINAQLDPNDSEDYQDRSLILTNKITKEMSNMTPYQQQKYLELHKHNFEEMEEFYGRRQRALDSSFNERRKDLLMRFRAERKNLYDSYTYKKKHFQFSKTVQDKKTLISILKQRNSLLESQNVSPYYSSERKHQKSDKQDDNLAKHEKELLSMIDEERAEHDKILDQSYNDELNQMVEKQREISKRTLQLYEYRKNETEKSRKRDITEILLSISIIQSIIKENDERRMNYNRFSLSHHQNAMISNSVTIEKPVQQNSPKFVEPPSPKTEVTLSKDETHFKTQIVDNKEKRAAKRIRKLNKTDEFDLIETEDDDEDPLERRKALSKQNFDNFQSPSLSKQRTANSQPTYGFADMKMISSVEDENAYDYGDCYPYEVEESEIEVTTTLSDLTKHKFY